MVAVDPEIGGVEVHLPGAEHREARRLRLGRHDPNFDPAPDAPDLQRDLGRPERQRFHVAPGLLLVLHLGYAHDLRRAAGPGQLAGIREHRLSALVEDRRREDRAVPNVLQREGALLVEADLHDIRAAVRRVALVAAARKSAGDGQARRQGARASVLRTHLSSSCRVGLLARGFCTRAPRRDFRRGSARSPTPTGRAAPIDSIVDSASHPQ